MDGTNSPHRWIWHDDGYGLDAESPLVISHSLWEDLTYSETGVKTLFSSTPESEVKEMCPPLASFEKVNSEAAEATYSGQLMSEDSPRFKRRRMLQFPGERGTLEPCHLDRQSNVDPSSEPLESCSDCHIGGYQDFRLQYEPEATSAFWHVPNEESLSSIEDAVEPPTNSLMATCFSEMEPDASQYPAASWTTRCIDASEAQMWPNHTNVEWQCFGRGDFRTMGNAISDRDAAELPSPVFLPKSAASERSHASGEASARRPRRGATPVAYPFAVVKPSGVQGDVTLNDINERIMTGRAAPQRRSPPSLAERAPNVSGKSVVALTKIHTEGNGTITIVRTKN